jgi:hypothetical protein
LNHTFSFEAKVPSFIKNINNKVAYREYFTLTFGRKIAGLFLITFELTMPSPNEICNPIVLAPGKPFRNFSIQNQETSEYN